VKDFTITIYRNLLSALLEERYHFQTFQEFVQRPLDRSIVLRHDVDDRKEHSLQFAKIQQELGIVGTYYFRMVPQSFDESVILQIAEMGHEIGYHYEDMDFAKGDTRLAIDLFQQHLEKLREIVPIRTICMHGSPRSKFDNRSLWEVYDYKDYEIIGEPYFDVDYRQVFYLTDTGRSWDGHKVSIRDKVDHHFPHRFKHTAAIIESAKNKDLPAKIMMTFHPQRWTDSRVLWVQEKYNQKVKNIVKYWLVKAAAKTG
jgi:hypothetical protein